MKTSIHTFSVHLTLYAMVVMGGCAGKADALGEYEQPASSQDRTLSPYFFVKSDDPDTDPLPLKHTSADIRISGVIAHVTISQVYKNEGKNTLEAIYIFPASTRAAVHAMRMTLGERIIEADIMERQKARLTYEQARQEGRTASLLEQQRPNVFQMNVANILPGDEIRTELQYTELVVPEDQIYEFIFPTVVGPRYSNTPAAIATEFETWVENPYLHSREPAPYPFDLKLEIQTGIPIRHLTSPSHDISAEYSSATRAHVAIKEDSKAAAKDFVLRYKLAGGQIQTGLLLYPGEDENFFLLMIEPPTRARADSVVSREYIFILDVSGSMHGFPIGVSKALMKDIITELRPSDFMNVLLFAGGSAVLSEGSSLPATEENKRKAMDWINAQQGGGGTEILPALRRALALPRAEGISRSLVVVTDGYVSIEPQVFEMIRKNLGQANLFAFGIGKSVNRHIIEGMARVGLGEPFVVLNEGEAREKAAKFCQYIESPVLTDIGVRFEGIKARVVEPVAVPDLFALRPIIIFGKYEGDPSGEIFITGRTATGGFKKNVRVDERLASTENKALRLLWARHRIMRISDLNLLSQDDDRVKEVTQLGLKFSLMTQYTSFVAVDMVKRANGEIVTVKQPIPLPEGVSDLAVGDSGLRVSALAPGTVGNSASTSPKLMQEAYPQLSSREREAATVEVGSSWRDKGQKVEKLILDLAIEESRGNIDKAVIQKTLQEKIEALRHCCLIVMDHYPPSGGEVVFRIPLNEDGTVGEVTVVSSSSMDAKAVDCMRKVIQKTSFLPATQGIGEVVIKLTCRSKG
jgi:Ca-activated chloride channel family protein